MWVQSQSSRHISWSPDFQNSKHITDSHSLGTQRSPEMCGGSQDNSGTLRRCWGNGVGSPPSLRSPSQGLRQKQFCISLLMRKILNHQKKCFQHTHLTRKSTRISHISYLDAIPVEHSVIPHPTWKQLERRFHSREEREASSGDLFPKRFKTKRPAVWLVGGIHSLDGRFSFKIGWETETAKLKGWKLPLLH